MKNLSALLKKIGEVTIKVIVFQFFIFLAGLLFWAGFNPFFTGVDFGIPFQNLFRELFLMSLINIVGAILCVFYAFMVIFPLEILEKKRK